MGSNIFTTGTSGLHGIMNLVNNSIAATAIEADILSFSNSCCREVFNACTVSAAVNACLNNQNAQPVLEHVHHHTTV